MVQYHDEGSSAGGALSLTHALTLALLVSHFCGVPLAHAPRSLSRPTTTTRPPAETCRLGSRLGSDGARA